MDDLDRTNCNNGYFVLPFRPRKGVLLDKTSLCFKLLYHRMSYFKISFKGTVEIARFFPMRSHSRRISQHCFFLLVSRRLAFFSGLSHGFAAILCHFFISIYHHTKWTLIDQFLSCHLTLKSGLKNIILVSNISFDYILRNYFRSAITIDSFLRNLVSAHGE